MLQLHECENNLTATVSCFVHSECVGGLYELVFTSVFFGFICVSVCVCVFTAFCKTYALKTDILPPPKFKKLCLSTLYRLVVCTVFVLCM